MQQIGSECVQEQVGLWEEGDPLGTIKITEFGLYRLMVFATISICPGKGAKNFQGFRDENRSLKPWPEGQT